MAEAEVRKPTSNVNLELFSLFETLIFPLVKCPLYRGLLRIKQNNPHKESIHQMLGTKSCSTDRHYCHLLETRMSPIQFSMLHLILTVTDKSTVLSSSYCFLGLKETIMSFAQGHTDIKNNEKRVQTKNPSDCNLMSFLKQYFIVSIGIKLN